MIIRLTFAMSLRLTGFCPEFLRKSQGETSIKLDNPAIYPHRSRSVSVPNLFSSPAIDLSSFLEYII